MQSMTSPPPAPPSLPDPAARAAVALERAERRREMLEYLADWGMSLSKDICTRSMDSPYHPELKHDPGRSFASASRAVRLTLAMEERVETYILALCNGVTPIPASFGAAPADGRSAAGSGPAGQHGGEDFGKSIPGEAGDEAAHDIDEPRESREREWERLVEREDFEARFAGDCDACVDVVRRDLERVSSSLPPIHGEGRLGPSGPGGVGSPAAPPAPAASHTTRPWTLPKPGLDPPHEWPGARDPYRSSG
jgi:hypothetical protein